MRAAIRQRYGGLDVVEIRDIDMPELARDGVLVRVRAAAVNPYDYHVALAGRPYIARIGAGLRRPKQPVLGVDFAGTVEAVGAAARRHQVGDDVYGFATGAFAEYVHVREEGAVAPKPVALSFEEAAAAPTAGVTALQALRDHGTVHAGQHVLINGASGGVGTFAMQIAKASGAEVTGVCGTANIDLVRSLGADHVTDYHREDFTRTGRRYDLLIDIAGNRSWTDLRQALTDDGTCVLVGGPKDNRWLGPLVRWGLARAGAAFSSQSAVVMLAEMRRENLDTLRDMFEAGTLRSVIDRTYPFEDLPDALRHISRGHARGKVVITR